MTKRVLFNAYQPATGIELWMTDGTEAGTVLLKDINPGAGFSDPAQFTAFRGKVLFVADDGVNGRALWLTDGTSEGTTLVKDIRPGSADPSMSRFTVLGDKVVFRANDGANGSELWVTDGTTAGTVMLKDIAAGSLNSNPEWFTVFGDKLLFQANDGVHGTELWVSDGSAAGTMLLKDISPGTAGSFASWFTVFGDKVLFSASDGVHGTELWVTDGTATGTALLKDISTGSSIPERLTVFGDKVLFAAGDPSTGRELWITDGTSAGTVMLKDLVAGPEGSRPFLFFPFGDKVLFHASVSSFNDVELWITDGTAAGTFLLKDINPGSAGSHPVGFKVLGDKVLFQATTAGAGIEGWVTDGTPEGTMLLKDIAPGSANSFAGGGAVLGDIALFQANDLVGGTELWMTDGTSAGTVLVKDLVPGSNGSFPNSMTTISFAQSFLEGTSSDDLLAGSTGDDLLYGRDGNDSLDGGDGADEIEGGAGDDIVDGGGADDLLDGGEGSDSLRGGAGNDRLTGGAGVDDLDGGTGDDRLDLGQIEGDEEAHGGEGVDSLYASFAGADTTGLSSSLTANPQGGYDGWIGDGGGLRITFSGIERFNLKGAAGADALAGGGGDDILAGGGGDDELTGGNGVDSLDGGSGGDRMTGGAGDDSYRVDDVGDIVVEEEAGGTDEVRTSLAAYTLAAHVERLSGIDHGQSLTGNGLDNIITAGAGNDVLDGGAGADRMIGGAGNDVFVVDDSGDVVEDSAGTDEIRTGLEVYSLAAAATVENLTGTLASGQELTGNGLANRIVGGDGRDDLRGEGGADQLVGGGDDDLLDGGAGADSISGGAGNDLLDGGDDADTMSGGAGDDVYHLDNQSDSVVEEADGGIDEIRILDTGYYRMSANVENGTIVAGAWHFLIGNDLANVLTGSDGRNWLDGGAGADTLIGGKGSDTYQIDDVGDVIIEEEDDFPPTYIGDGSGDTVVTSLAEYALRPDLENLEGTSVQQRLVGTDRGNVMRSGGGQDTLIGGKGDDSYSVYAGDTIVELADEGIDTVYVNGGDFTLSDHLERLSGQSSSGQVLTGNGLANEIFGSSGSDTLDGAGGADAMAGGRGNDIYYVDEGDIVSEAAGEGTDEVRTSLAVYSLVGTNIENLRATSAVAHEFRGNSGNNVITGGGGNDLLYLNDGGNDIGSGGDGNDVFYFGASFGAADRADGGAGRDAVVLQGNVTLVLNNASIANMESISLQSGANDRFGDTANNRYDFNLKTADGNVAAGQQLIVNGQSLLAGEDFTFDGSAETNGKFLVYAGHGTDILKGGAGVDVFFFEGDRWGPNDRVDGGGGRDSVVISGGTGIKRVEFGADSLTNIESISVNATLASDPTAKPSYEFVLHNGNVAAGQTLILNANSITDPAQTASFDGSAEMDGNLTMFGGAGNDTLIGGAGGDLLYGGGGRDSLTGNSGADLFQWRASSESSVANPDAVLDFQPGTDKIHLLNMDANSVAPGDQAFTFIGSAAFNGTAGQLRAYESGGTWFVEGDTDGNGAADFAIAVTTQSAAALGQGDFIL